MKKIYGIRKIGTDLWASSFSCGKANLGPFGHNTRLFRKIGPAKGLANKHNKLTDNYVEVVEFDLSEVKKSPPDWKEFKKYVDEEIAKVKPLTPFIPHPAPYYPVEQDDPWRPHRRPPWKQWEAWCGTKPPNEPIMMNTPENPSLMVACST